MEFGDIVFHVANPFVKGMVVGRDRPGSKWIRVIFSEAVKFSGNTSAGFREHWLCSEELLFSSEEEALKNHDPLRA